MIENLKALRKEKGVSQQQLADVILMSQQSVNKYENHDVEPDIKTLIRIAEYFDVSLDYLVGRCDVKEMADKLHMSELSDEESGIIMDFRRLSAKQKQCIKQLIDSYES